MSSIGLWALCAIIPLAIRALGADEGQAHLRPLLQGRAAQRHDRRAGGGRGPASSGLPDLTIRPIAGRLTDHYDPRNRTLQPVARTSCTAASLAAVGVAAHEAGHAIQDARGYAPMRIRQTLVPVATIGSRCGSCRCSPA